MNEQENRPIANERENPISMKKLTKVDLVPEFLLHIEEASIVEIHPPKGRRRVFSISKKKRQ